MGISHFLNRTLYLIYKLLSHFHLKYYFSSYHCLRLLALISTYVPDIQKVDDFASFHLHFYFLQKKDNINRCTYFLYIGV